MKKIISFVLSISLVFGLIGFPMDQAYAAGNKIVIDLDVHAGHVSDNHISRGHSLNLVASVYDSNGNLLVHQPGDFVWTVTHADNTSDIHSFAKSLHIADKAKSHGFIYVPYTETANKIKLHVKSEHYNVEATHYYTITNSKYENHHTFFYCVKGSKAASGKAPAIKETWNQANESYTMTAPKNTFKRSGYKLKYWIDDYGTKYKPGDSVTLYRKKHGKLTAVWTKKTYKNITNVKATRKSDSSIRVSWGKVEDANGYNIYRYSSSKKKFVKVKNIRKGNTTSWTNKKLKAETTYKYKVQAIKKVNGKTQAQSKSPQVSAVTSSTSKGNVSKVTLNKKKINMKVGSTVKVKAKTKVKSNKSAVSKKIKWYTTDKSVATISKKGKITARSKGTCYVYAQAHNGKNSKRIKVTVK